MRKHAVDRPRRCRLSGLISIEADDGLWHQLPEQLHLPLGESSAERGDSIGEARLIDRDDVHIAFDHDELAGVERGLASAGKVEDGRTLVEEPRLWRVQIFRLRCWIEGAGAEGDHARLGVENRNAEAVAETVINGAPIVRLYEQACIEKVCLAKALLQKCALQRVLGVRCEADTELFQRLG